MSTTLYYLGPREDFENEKPYFINYPVSGFSGALQTNMNHLPYKGIQIHDIRDNEADFHLDTQGFQLVKHSTNLSNEDFEDDATIRARYYPEMVQLVKDELQATKVFVFEHTVCRLRISTTNLSLTELASDAYSRHERLWMPTEAKAPSWRPHR